MQSRGLNLQKSSRSGPVSQNDITYPRPLHKWLFIWSYANSCLCCTWNMTCSKDEYMISVCLPQLWESYKRCPGRGSDQGKGWSSIWLASCFLPRPATCRGKVTLISKAGYLVQIQLSQVLDSSGSREHLSLSLSWVQNLIKALFKGVGVCGMEVMRNEA